MEHPVMELRKNFMFMIIVVDIIWLIASVFDTDITVFKKSNFIIPIVLHIVLFFWLGYKRRGRKKVLFVGLIIFSFLLLIKHLFTPIFDSYSYEHLHIPGNHDEIVVEHRANLIDQGIKEYRVYQTRIRGLLLTELTDKEIVIVEPHGSYLSQKDIFDYSAPE